MRAMTPGQPTPAGLQVRAVGEGEVKPGLSCVLSANTHHLFVLSADLHRQRRREGGRDTVEKDTEQQTQDSGRYLKSTNSSDDPHDA